MERQLDLVAEESHYNALGQYVAKAIERSKGTKINPATTTSDVSKISHKKWATLAEKLQIVSGKDALRRFRKIVQDETGLSLTDAVIVSAFQTAEIADDLAEMLAAPGRFTS